MSVWIQNGGCFFLFICQSQTDTRRRDFFRQRRTTRDQGVSHVTWCVFVYSNCVPLSVVCVGEHTICAVCESADGTPQHAFFPQQQWKLIQENNPALGLCCGAAHCPWRCVVVCLYCMCRSMYTCVCLLPGINRAGCVPAGDSA